MKELLSRVLVVGDDKGKIAPKVKNGCDIPNRRAEYKELLGGRHAEGLFHARLSRLTWRSTISKHHRMDPSTDAGLEAMARLVIRSKRAYEGRNESCT